MWYRPFRFHGQSNWPAVQVEMKGTMQSENILDKLGTRNSLKNQQDLNKFNENNNLKINHFLPRREHEMAERFFFFFCVQSSIFNKQVYIFKKLPFKY